MKTTSDDKKSKRAPKGSKEINYLDVALEATVAAIPFLGPSAAALLRASRDSQKASETNDLDVLTQEADRQRVELLMAEMQAKVAQEMAIAQRIQTASEVEIEEYYEGSGEASAGISASDKIVTVGVGGKGNKVTKRVYRFKGHNQPAPEAPSKKESA